MKRYLSDNIGLLQNSRWISPHSVKRGFTLIELLVVIAIIALLVSILLPSLNTAKMLAKRAVCMSNHRQIGSAFAVYASENNGFTPMIASRISPSTSLIQTWGDVLGPCLGFEPQYDQSSTFGQHVLPNQGIYRCPENTVQQRPMGNGAGEIYTSYGANGYDVFNWGALNPRRQALGASLSDMRYPSELFMVMDKCYYRTDVYDIDGSGSVPDLGLGGIEFMRYAHNSGVNVLYADGHVAWLEGPVVAPENRTGPTYYADSYSNGHFWFYN